MSYCSVICTPHSWNAPNVGVIYINSNSYFLHFSYIFVKLFIFIWLKPCCDWLS